MFQIAQRRFTQP
jgi:pilus assembly protein Flp/PilA